MTDLPLQVDVNEWWSLDEALDACARARDARRRVRRAAAARRATPEAQSSGAARRCPIYVDEDCHTLADVARLRARSRTAINIKLAKSGGIREAIRMAHAARALGLGVMLGCMVESGLGIAAGCVVAPLCDHVDLDGNLLLAQRPRSRASRSSTACRSPSEEVGLGCRVRATLILAEGFSADPHYGKTMRGVLRYRREDVVAILDSTRAGESEDGVPIVGDVDDGARATSRTVALVGVATQGGRFPPAWRELLRGLRPQRDWRSRTGCTSSSATIPSFAPLADAHGVELRDLRRPPAGLDCPTGANLEVARARSCSRSARTARSGR